MLIRPPPRPTLETLRALCLGMHGPQSLFVETFDADGNDGDGPLYYLDERSKVMKSSAPFFLRRSKRVSMLQARCGL